MKVEQTVLTLAGLAGIGAFFLPFLHIEPKVAGIQVADITVSGLSYVRTVLDIFKVQEYEGGRALVETFRELWGSSEIKGKLTIAGLLFVLTGPIFYLLHSVAFVIRGLFGKQFKRGILFNIFFPAAAWGILYAIGQTNSLDIGIGTVGVNLNFFTVASLGFWVAFASVWVAGFSLLFEKTKS
ncbi:MAG: hypothetical protein EAZ89_13275 [Bacteroidetes bacterium]|jgi:hypothetical protein|nr:MAG: hypothetical protein EAZ89_13275 [Bacteroidota bacterium]